MISAQIAIPWRPTPDRIAAFDRCMQFWAEHNFPVVTADSDPVRPFLCNEARNRAIAQVRTDLVIIADGDTLPADIAQIHEAIRIVTENPTIVVWPYTTYVYLFTWEVANPDLANARVVHALEDMSGGLIVAHKDILAELGGFDENFTPGAWGYDDLAFYHCAQTLTTIQRLPGRVYSFEHQSDRDVSEKNPNRQRFDQVYLPAIGHPELMRAISKRRSVDA